MALYNFGGRLCTELAYVWQPEENRKLQFGRRHGKCDACQNGCRKTLILHIGKKRKKRTLIGSCVECRRLWLLADFVITSEYKQRKRANWDRLSLFPTILIEQNREKRTKSVISVYESSAVAATKATLSFPFQNNNSDHFRYFNLYSTSVDVHVWVRTRTNIRIKRQRWSTVCVYFSFSKQRALIEIFHWISAASICVIVWGWYYNSMYVCTQRRQCVWHEHRGSLCSPVTTQFSHKHIDRTQTPPYNRCNGDVGIFRYRTTNCTHRQTHTMTQP